MTVRQSKIIAISLIVITACAITAMTAVRFSRGRRPHIDVNRSELPVRGADLSAHNGLPDFDSLVTAIDFVYLKASEGSTFRDPQFPRNSREARSAGLPRGAYHFFRFDTDGERQARNFMDAMAGQGLELPPAIDLEEWCNPAQISTDLIIERLRTMTALLRANGYEPIIYTNKKGYSRFVVRGFEPDNRPELWISSFTDPPLASRQWTFWQHSHCGSLPGVRGAVDLDVFNGTGADFADYLSRQQPENQGRR